MLALYVASCTINEQQTDKCFRKLLFKSNNKKFSLRRVESYEVTVEVTLITFANLNPGTRITEQV